MRGNYFKKRLCNLYVILSYLQSDDKSGNPLEEDTKQVQNVTSSAAPTTTPVPGSTDSTVAAEVDEDGYSIQPAKEIAWEENTENGKIRFL